MWRFFGIFRDVYLYTIPSLHVTDIFAKAGLDEAYEKGVLDVSAKVVGKPSLAVLSLIDLESQERVFESSMEVSGEEAKLHMEGLVIKKWSAEEPNLYELRIALKDEPPSSYVFLFHSDDSLHRCEGSNRNQFR